jgi:hypothetical protein
MTIRSGAANETLAAFESRFGVQLPMDMMHFYCHTDGMADDELDANSRIKIWPLNRVNTLAAELPEYSRNVEKADQAFVFADHLFWSLGYVVWLSQDLVAATPVFLVGDEPPILVAHSFSTFLCMYLNELPGILPKRKP